MLGSVIFLSLGKHDKVLFCDVRIGSTENPPDRGAPPEAGEHSNKKTKLEEPFVPVVDEDMGSSQDDHPGHQGLEGADKPQPKFASYRASLMGFNGVRKGETTVEEDDLMLGDDDFEWPIPKPSEETQRLMEVYPVIPVTQEEYNEWCEPWKHALILTVLGRRFNMY